MQCGVQNLCENVSTRLAAATALRHDTTTIATTSVVIGCIFTALILLVVRAHARAFYSFVKSFRRLGVFR